MRSALERSGPRWPCSRPTAFERTAPPLAAAPREPELGLLLGADPRDEASDLLEQLAILGSRTAEAAVRHRFPDVELGIDSRPPKLAVEQHRVGQEKIAGAGLNERRRKPAQVREQRRKIW